MAKRVAMAGIFVSLALIFSYVESLISFNFGIPGIKLGLANVVIVTGLYLMKLPDVCLISMIRIFVSGLLFGNMMSLIYSLSGGILSLIVMLLLKRTNKFSVIGVSISGAVCHNIGQIAAAIIVAGVPVIVYYLPVLMVVGIITGAVMGIIASRILAILTRSIKISNM